jgi:hypothetical protein
LQLRGRLGMQMLRMARPRRQKFFPGSSCPAVRQSFLLRLPGT